MTNVNSISLVQNGHITRELSDYIVSVTDSGFMKNICFRFENGMGASVSDLGSLASAAGYELAVLDEDGDLCYTTEITDDVLPGLTGPEVADYLYRIRDLNT